MHTSKSSSIGQILLAVVAGAARGVLAAVQTANGTRSDAAAEPARSRIRRRRVPKLPPADPFAADFLLLVAAIARDIKAATLCEPFIKEYTFAGLISMCRANKLFDAEMQEGARHPYVITPGSISFSSRSVLGKYFRPRFAGLVVTVHDGQRVRLTTRCRCRHRKFVAEILA